MGIIESIRNNLIFTITKSIEKQIDGREITKNLDTRLDQQVGEKTSEKIQRGPITQLLFEMLEGLWSENLSELNTRVEKWQHSMGKKE